MFFVGWLVGEFVYVYCYLFGVKWGLLVDFEFYYLG